MRRIIAVTALAAVVMAGGCIEKETAHTIYLSPEGVVAWTTMERDVRSASDDAQAREREEASYLADAVAGRNALSVALSALDGIGVKTRVLRRERPFSVLTEARFPAVDALGLRLLGELRVPGDVDVTTDGDITTLHIHLDFRGFESDDSDPGSPVLSLVDELSTYRIVLTQGRFVSATGFTLDEKQRVARPVATSEEVPNDVVDLSLSWRGHAGL